MSTVRPRPRQNEEATSAFLRRVIAVQDLLGRLQARAENHWGVTPEGLDWGHVGTLAEVERLLRRAVEFTEA